MASEEDTHRAALVDEHRRRFGDVIPLIRREHVAGFYNRRPVWLIENLGPERVREEAARMEMEARDFYRRAAQRPATRARDSCSIRLAAAEIRPPDHVAGLVREHLPPKARAAEDAEAHRQFVLTWVQPGLAGLMDGSVSTLAPIFAAAFATGTPGRPFSSASPRPSAPASRWASLKRPDDGTISGVALPSSRESHRAS